MKNIKILLLALTFAVATFSVAFAGKKPSPLTVDGATTINADRVIELLDEYDDLVIIDSRKPSDFKAAHIEDAEHLPNTETNAETLAKVLESKDTHVIFYCNGVNCGRSSKAVKIAVSEGYKNVYYFRGGIAEWKEKSLPIVTGE